MSTLMIITVVLTAAYTAICVYAAVEMAGRADDSMEEWFRNRKNDFTDEQHTKSPSSGAFTNLEHSNSASTAHLGFGNN